MRAARTSDALALIAVIAGAGVCPAAAGAVEVAREGSTVLVTDPAGEPGGLRVYRDAAAPDAVLFTSTSGSRVKAAAGCSQLATRQVGVGPDIVACPSLGLATLRLDLGGGADSLYAGTDVAGPVPWAVVATTGPGRDHVEIQGAGAVAVDLGPGSDYLLAGSQLGPMSARGGSGDDLLHTTGPAGAALDGGRGADLLTGSLALDQLTGAEGNDRFSFFGRDPANLRSDVLRCGPGDDTVDTQPVPGADAGCPAEIVLPRRARLTDSRIDLRVRVAEPVKGRFEIYAEPASGRIDFTRDGRRTLEAGARTLRLRLTDRGARSLDGDDRRAAKLHVVLDDASGDTRDVLVPLTLRR